MSSIIEVDNLSKSFLLDHQEGAKQYTTLRDVMARSAKKIFSFPSWLRPAVKMRREEFWALKDVSFNIEPGDRVGIIGRNGAGKSTLLKILSRITEPTAGQIKIKGRVASLLEVGTGFHPELTGRENIYLNGAILGMARAEIKSKFDEIVAFAEVERFLDTPVKRYSSGMYVRLAFAVAAHLEPEILIVDEVLAVGDVQFQKKCLGKMQDVSSNEGRTVLFVSHNMGTITQLCNKGILLKGGSIFHNADIQSTLATYISSDDKGDYYEPSERITKRKKNYFSKIFASNGANEQSGDFSFDESITLNFEFVVGDPVHNLQIGIGLNDKFQNRISTILKPIDFFEESNGKFKAKVTLPHSLILPNHYSFVFALWTKDGFVYDLVENVCPVKIHDNGTDLAMYEGGNHGSVMLIPTWNND
jgi:lipopolysaccharide transport system ATP-binding protein